LHQDPKNGQGPRKNIGLGDTVPHVKILKERSRVGQERTIEKGTKNMPEKVVRARKGS